MSSEASSAVPTLEELLARLQRGEAPAGGYDSGYDTLAFTLPTSDASSPARITARMATRNDHAVAVPPEVMRAIEAHVLSFRGCVHLESATEEELSRAENNVGAAPPVFPAGFPCVILYIYPLDDAKSPDWVYETAPHGGGAQGLALRDIVRCIAATYKVMYAAEACAVGAAAHAARVGPGVLNRGRTEGPFGIWGHDLGDLVLEGFTWAPNADGGGGGALLPMIGS
jgi:hypothetical protein